MAEGVFDGTGGTDGIEVGVELGTGVAVTEGLGKGVAVGSGEAVGLTVEVGRGRGVAVGVMVGAGVGVGPGVIVGAGVTVGPGVMVGAGVGVGPGVIVGAGVGNWTGSGGTAAPVRARPGKSSKPSASLTHLVLAGGWESTGLSEWDLDSASGRWLECCMLYLPGSECSKSWMGTFGS